mmetsp:Transcript_33315/g.51838  ORF Transcript_33315/g.51838 Transcript_33315/m.51838 type:complete len:116 (+) Transcript_33315:182-529(+)
MIAHLEEKRTKLVKERHELKQEANSLSPLKMSPAPCKPSYRENIEGSVSPLSIKVQGNISPLSMPVNREVPSLNHTVEVPKLSIGKVLTDLPQGPPAEAPKARNRVQARRPVNYC